MVSVSEATSIIESHLYVPKIEEVDISSALGRVLAEPINADRDFPPFHRVAMDGIAINFEPFEQGQNEFMVEGIAAAGNPQKTLSDKANCMEVMTGAPMPLNADTVIKYEDLELKNNQAKVLIKNQSKGQNIHRQAQDAKQDQVLLPAGTRLSPAEVALIAAVGKPKIKVKTFPGTAIISTGDELIDINDTPAAHQIRRSNSYALQAALKSLGCSSTLYHIPDKKDLIEKELKIILDNHELLILSGGVSKGKFDYIPDVLEQLGVKKHFHRVKQKPGKPFWFGSVENKTVFALPGNPVSTYMCFYKYIESWLLKSWGLKTQTQSAQLAADFEFKGDLTYFLQVSVSNENGCLVGTPTPGGGSGDFANLKHINAFMELPEGAVIFGKGEAYPVLFFRT